MKNRNFKAGYNPAEILFLHMNLFFTDHIVDNIAILGKEESRHCVQVLRKKEGDAIRIIDGKGGWHEAILIDANKKSCTARIEKSTLEHKKRTFHLHIAIAPTKNIARLEWFLEKATEIGIDEISLVLCKHSERKIVREDRLEKILLAATKQSLNAYLPKLNTLQALKDFLNQEPSPTAQQFIGYCGEDVNTLLQENYTKNKDVIILIGPEGDFTIEEVALAQAKGFSAISLGANRLRTETAGIVACHTINLLNQ